ncbi:hypothetical protein BpHYR1_017541 [Brachionus plicatilis]|uniref:Uncharacterized protein n=1 Tax=Brachionus plicatilis TaxID=10195 RepID=A0A3M7PGS8_BRAPC|nr:hypothetical protein BpHYR1_017541 [Brachionus plicatilis]
MASLKVNFIYKKIFLSILFYITTCFTRYYLYLELKTKIKFKNEFQILKFQIINSIFYLSSLHQKLKKSDHNDLKK